MGGATQPKAWHRRARVAVEPHARGDIAQGRPVRLVTASDVNSGRKPPSGNLLLQMKHPERPLRLVPIPHIMKLPPVLPILCSVLVGCSTGCSTSSLSRIDRNRDRYESWPVDVQEAVLNGEARPGMTREQVEMALGKPAQILSHLASGGGDEVWVYRAGDVGSTLTKAVSVASVGTSVGGVSIGARGGGVSVGSGVGGVNVGTTVGGSRSRPTSDEKEIVFKDGVVLRVDAGP